MSLVQALSLSLKETTIVIWGFSKQRLSMEDKYLHSRELKLKKIKTSFRLCLFINPLDFYHLQLKSWDAIQQFLPADTGQ